MSAYDRRPERGSGSDRPSPGGGTSVVEVQYYKDPGQKVLNPDLLDNLAEKQAGALHDKINSSQVRRFFGEVKSIYLCLQENRPWSDLEPRFRMLKSRAYYASGTQRIPRVFCDFLATNIDKVKNEKDFRAFVQYFEAVLGFMYGKGLVTK